MYGNTNGYYAYAKTGKVFDKELTSIGFQMSGKIYQQDELWGRRKYDAKQKALYFNAIYQSHFGNTIHQYKTGLSAQYDSYNETLNAQNFDRKESSTGAFFEYTYLPHETLTMVAGVRLDYHNKFDFIFTPRFHLKYQPFTKTSIRLSAGLGHQTANIFSEYKSVLASSREVQIHRKRKDTPYGLEQEKAWNFGINISQKFYLFKQEAIFTLDAYRTQFINQIIADYDKSIYAVHFYNLKGESYANSLQLQLDYEPLNNLEFRLAYRMYDLVETYAGEKHRKLFSSKHRGFIHLNYTLNSWSGNITTNWQSSKQLPQLKATPPNTYPTQYQRSTQSPYFSTTNIQLNKTFGKTLDIYLGIENLFNFTQKSPIIAADKPFSPYFDSSRIWGPIYGRQFYAGIRFKIL